MNRVRVGLLFGGRSVEHEVSVISARGVAEAIEGTSLTCVPLAVTGDGRWLSPELSAEILLGPAARTEPSAGQDDGAWLVIEPGSGRLIRLAPQASPATVEVDVVFPLVHGWGGEDGRLQGALELGGIPYVGAGVLGSAAAMDKAVAKLIFQAAGLPVTRWITIHAHESACEAGLVAGRIEAELGGFPVFVKPANGGSSVGVARVARADGLSPALATALECDPKVVVETAVDAREIECAVLGNADPEASVLGEIIPSREFYDYAAKYLDGTSRLVIPAELEVSASQTIRDLALRAYRALDLCGLARVDFLVDRRRGEVWVNEVNTLPGFTPISMFPKLWEASGLSYGGLVERLVRLGLERSQAAGQRRTRWQEERTGRSSGKDARRG